MADSSPPLPPEAFDLDPDVLWVMHCAEGVVPLTAVEAVTRFLERELHPWNLQWDDEFRGLPRRVREQAAELWHGRPRDMTLVDTTTSGLVRIAQGLSWQVGDEVVAPLGEFPANAWPWKVLPGVTFREVPLWDGHRAGADAWVSAPPPVDVDPESRLLDALGPATRLLSVSWVRFQDGLKLDVARLAEGCRERGVVLVVDGIQGAGTQPIRLDALDGLSAFASGGHKGLLGPQGVGLLWAEETFRQRLVPPGGWLSVEDADDFDRPSTDLNRGWMADGSRLEQGVPNLIGCAALGESLTWLNHAGMERVAGWIAHLQRSLLDRLEEAGTWAEDARRLRGLLDRDRLAGIVSLHHGDRGLDGLNHLLRTGKDRGVYASVREGYLRIAFHGFHRERDVERVVRWLA